MALINGKFINPEYPIRLNHDPVGATDVTRKSYVDTKASTEANSAKVEAKSYTDEKISMLINGAPEMLDTLKELAEAIGNDEHFSATITASLSYLQTRAAQIEVELASEIAARQLADQELQSELDQEILSRQAADSVLETEIEQEILDRQAADATEKAERQAADTAEQQARMAADQAEAATRASEDVRVLGESKAYTDAEKARAMAAEASEASIRASEDVRVLNESKQYADMSIAAVIDSAPEAYNTLREIAEYISSDQSATTQILSQLYDHETRLDVVEGTGEGSIQKAEQDAKDYTDMEVSEEASIRASEDVRVLGESKAYTDEEKTRAMAAEAAEANIRALEDDRVLSESKSYTDQEVAGADSRRAMYDAQVQQAAQNYTDMQVAQEAQTRNLEDQRVLTEARSYTDLEKTRAENAEYMEASTRASEDVRVLQEAKSYTDMETARATSAETSERDAREAADSYIQGQVDSIESRVDVLEAIPKVEGNKSSVVLTSEHVSTGYIDLNKVIMPNTLMVSVSGTVQYEGDDYTVSTVNSMIGPVTRVTLIGDIYPDGDGAALVVGDKIHFQFLTTYV